jgi:hypothetical protein
MFGEHLATFVGRLVVDTCTVVGGALRARVACAALEE